MKYFKKYLHVCTHAYIYTSLLYFIFCFDECNHSYCRVIAVNQDNLGKQGTRISGGALSGGGSPFPRVHLDDCCDGKKCTGQQWKLDSPAEGYIQASSGGCVNADDCQSDVIVYDSCPTSGCCNDCDNMIFKLDAATGYIKAGMLF